jgi:integrase
MAENLSGGLMRSLSGILKEHNGVRYNGSTAGKATQAKRINVLYASFKYLRTQGYKLKDARGLGGRHIETLVKHWIDQKLSASSLQNHLSILRTFARWIEKAGLVKPTRHYFPNGEARRSSINKVDKSWTARGVDIESKLAEVRARFPTEEIKLAFQVLMGLRVMESIQLQPHIADKGTHLHITRGAKGGRERFVPIDTPEKRALVDRAKASVRYGESLSDARRNAKQAKWYFYYALRACGITRRQLGVTAHGLRHEYANNRYQEKAGMPSPVRGGGKVDRAVDRVARQALTQELGHCRPNHTTHYVGR